MEICSQGCNEQKAIIGSDNGLAPNRWQAIIWSNDDLVYCLIYALLGHDGLIKHNCIWKSPLNDHSPLALEIQDHQMSFGI